MTNSQKPPRVDTRPSQAARRKKRILNKAAHLGISVSPHDKLEDIDAAIALEVNSAAPGHDRARVLELRARVVGEQARLAKITPPAGPRTPEEAEQLAIAYLSSRGCIVRRNGKRLVSVVQVAAPADTYEAISTVVDAAQESTDAEAELAQWGQSKSEGSDDRADERSG